MRRKWKGTWGCPHAEWATHSLCKPCLDRPRNMLWTDWKGDAGSSICTTEIWPVRLQSLRTVQSDHKLLAAISNKPLRSAPKRLQGMLLKIQKYDVTIVYKPGPEMYLADTLSRAFLPTTENTQGEFECVNVVKLLPMTDERLEEIRSSTRDDDVLQQLKEVIQIGWPEEKQELPAVLAPYFNFRDEMSIYEGLIFKGERLLILKQMRPKMKERLHSSHIGVNGCLRRARECMYWPSMTAELKEYISQCETCSKYKVRQQR